MSDDEKKQLADELMKGILERLNGQDSPLQTEDPKKAKRKKITNVSSVAAALLAAILALIQNQLTDGDVEDASARAQTAAQIAQEASKEEKASAAYELVIGAIKEQQTDIRELREELREVRRDLSRVYRRNRPRPTVPTAAGVGPRPMSDEASEGEEEPDYEEDVGPMEPTKAEKLPTKLEDLPRVKAIEARQEQMQIQAPPP